MRALSKFTGLVAIATVLTACGGGGSSGGGSSGSSATYSVGGTVTGLATTQVVLLNNGSDQVTVNANGTFAFPTAVSTNGNYAVTIGSQPTGQTCTVTNGTGSGVTSNVTNVAVNCSAITYTISGSVSGLSNGSQVVLEDNGADPITVTANSTFLFAVPVAYNGSYAVTVRTQPTGQTCTVNNGTGAGVTANVSNITVTCTTNAYTVGGTVSGLRSGAQVTLQNNSADPITLTGNGTYTFATPVAYNGSYTVTVGTQPVGQTCSVTNGVGSGISANVSNVSVTCSTNTYTISGTTSGLNTGLQLTLQNNGGDSTVVTGNVSGAFPTPVAYGGTYSVTVSTQPVGQSCTVTNGSGTVYSDVTNVAIACTNIPGKYVYAANFNGNSISEYSLDNNTGNLTQISGSPISAVDHPTYLAAHPNGKFLYVASSNDLTPVSAYLILGSTGSLLLGNHYDDGGGSYGLAIDRQGRFLFLADASGYVDSYAINQTTGGLTFVGAYAAGTVPVSVAVDPTSKYVYVLNQTSANISAFSLDATTGVLTFIANYTTGTGGYSITVDPSGKNLYSASVRTGHNVQAYSINSSTGALSLVGGYGGSGNTDYVAVNPTGEFVYNVNAGNVIAYSRNASTGALTSIGTFPNGGSGGNAIVIDPLNKYAYVPNKGSNDVSILTIDQSTGALTAGTPVASGSYVVSVAIAIQQ